MAPSASNWCNRGRPTTRLFPIKVTSTPFKLISISLKVSLQPLVCSFHNNLMKFCSSTLNESCSMDETRRHPFANQPSPSALRYEFVVSNDLLMEIEREYLERFDPHSFHQSNLLIFLLFWLTSWTLKSIPVLSRTFRFLLMYESESLRSLVLKTSNLALLNWSSLILSLTFSTILL